MSELTTNPFAVIDEKPDPEVPVATLGIYQFISEALARKEDTGIDRASSATMCVRRRWLQGRGEKGAPIGPRRIVNFFLGALSEAVLLYFVKEALVGPGKLYASVDLGERIGSFPFDGKEVTIYKQKTLEWKINDKITVSCHLDGMGIRNLDNQPEIIECKSASDYGYSEFKTEGPGDYLRQAHACMMASGARSIRYFYIHKNLGSLWDRLYNFEQAMADQVMESFIRARAEAIPDRPFDYVDETFRSKPTGRKKLPFPCNGYCPYTMSCFPDSIKEFKSGRPIWLQAQCRQT